jgi:hypothetical protein
VPQTTSLEYALAQAILLPRWGRYVACMGRQCDNFGWKASGQEVLGRWRGLILKRVYRRRGYKEIKQIELAENKFQCRAFITTVINIQVPQREDLFNLIYSTTLSIAQTILYTVESDDKA